MDTDENRQSFFKYNLLEDETILERQDGRKRIGSTLLECCSTLPRCFNLLSFLLSMAISLFLSMGPWALALTEVVIQSLLYILVLYDGHWRHVYHIDYSWYKSEEDVVVFSYLRCLLGLVALCLGLWQGTHKPYLITDCLLSGLGLAAVSVKAVSFRKDVMGKWGGLLLSSAIFSALHVFVAINVFFFAQMRRRVTSFPNDVENPRQSEDSASILEKELAGKKSHFIECSGLRVHYTLTKSQECCSSECSIVLIHGFGGGCFSWRHISQELATVSGLPVYAFDRPGFGLTSRPILSQEDRHSIRNPYQLPFQTDLVLHLCELWGCKAVILLGHSDGALLALHAAAKSVRYRAFIERSSLQQRVKQGHQVDGSPPSEELTGSRNSSLAYSPPYRENKLQVQVAENSSMASDGPSSPFSQWLQLGQPETTDSLQPGFKNLGCDAVDLSRHASSNESLQHCLPSFQLEEASALLGPRRNRFTGVSTAIYVPQGDGWQVDQLKGSTELQGLILLNPSFQGESKPAIAKVLSSSRMGRHVLRRVLQGEVGEIRNKKAWFDSSKMTEELLGIYSRPLRLQDSAQGLVEASRLQREVQPHQIEDDFEQLNEVPMLICSSESDKIASRLDAAAVKDRKSKPDFQNISGSGHFSIEEQPSQVVQHVALFLRGLGLGQPHELAMVFSPSPFQGQTGPWQDDP